MEKEEMPRARNLLSQLCNREMREVLGRFDLPGEFLREVAPLRERPKCTCIAFCTCFKRNPDPPTKMDLITDSILTEIPFARLLEAINRALGST